MDLREVLVEAPCVKEAVQGPGYYDPKAGPRWVCGYGRMHRECALARLSQPDVLDEFERRILATRFSSRPPHLEARRVLADMLGGDS